MRSSGASDTVYRQRVLTALAGVLTAAVLLVHGWPDPASSPSEAPFSDRTPDRIQIETIQPTSQPREQSPPPPAPLPPVVVPNDVIVEQDVEFEDGALQVETPSDDAERQAGDRDPVGATQQPDTGARLLRNVQPKYPMDARDDDIRARVRVEVSVSAEGRVESATVLDRWRVSEEGHARPVAQLGYGLEAAALSAAQRSLFRPARHEGRPVPTRTTLTFTFGD
ncbi:MAG: energy transducer TonB [Salinivenus sp.]